MWPCTPGWASRRTGSSPATHLQPPGHAAFGIASSCPSVITGYTGIIRAHASGSIEALIVGAAGAAIPYPGGDVFSQMAMAVPMIVLYEVCIIVTAVFERKRNRRAGSSLPAGD